MKTGLVLEGGGAKGAFHCGVIKALYDHGYSFDGAVGTSIGAINAAILVQDKGYKTLLDLWKNITPSMLLDVDDIKVEKLYDKDFDKSTVKYWLKKFGQAIRSLGIPIDKSLETLQHYISEDKVRKSDMDFGMVTYSLSDREPVEIFCEDIPEGSLLNFILASAYYPAFRLQRLDGKYYIDGGVHDNMPIALLASKDYERIIAIRTMSKRHFSVPARTDIKIEYICPSEDLGKTMQVTRKMIDRNIKLGYYDGMRFINGYIGKRFYIDGDFEELKKAFFSSGYEKIDLRLIEDIGKKNPLNSEEDNFIEYLEEYAAYFGMEKYYVYKSREFVDNIKDRLANILFTDRKMFNFISKENTKKQY